MSQPSNFGRTIQLYLVDGTPNGLIVASIHGWTGSVLVAKQSTFGQLLARPEVKRTGCTSFMVPIPRSPWRCVLTSGKQMSLGNE